VYNGVTKPLEVELEQPITAVLQKVIALFAISQNPHLLYCFARTASKLPKQKLSNMPDSTNFGNNWRVLSAASGRPGCQ